MIFIPSNKANTTVIQKICHKISKIDFGFLGNILSFIGKVIKISEKLL